MEVEVLDKKMLVVLFQWFITFWVNRCIHRTMCRLKRHVYSSPGNTIGGSITVL